MKPNHTIFAAVVAGFTALAHWASPEYKEVILAAGVIVGRWLSHTNVGIGNGG